MPTNQELRQAIREIAKANPELSVNASRKDDLRILHGYVQKYYPGQDGKSGTIDFVTMDQTLFIPHVSVSSIPGLKKGTIYEPTKDSDVTVLWKVGTSDASIIAFSHVDVQRINTTKEVSIGVTEEEYNDQNDYDEQNDTGKKSETVYTKDSITSKVLDNGQGASVVIKPDSVTSTTKNAKTEQADDKVEVTVGGAKETLTKDTYTVDAQKINIGEGATEQALLGTQTAALLVDFITACSQITVPTMLGTMPIINIPQFTALLPRCEQIKSQIVKLK